MVARSPRGRPANLDATAPGAGSAPAPGGEGPPPADAGVPGVPPEGPLPPLVDAGSPPSAPGAGPPPVLLLVGGGALSVGDTFVSRRLGALGYRVTVRGISNEVSATAAIEAARPTPSWC